MSRLTVREIRWAFRHQRTKVTAGETREERAAEHKKACALCELEAKVRGEEHDQTQIGLAWETLNELRAEFGDPYGREPVEERERAGKE